MATKTVVLFGAGATKACGGPLTNEIIPQAFDPAVLTGIEREQYLHLVDSFLVENFHLPQQPSEGDYPALPLLLSLVDTAIHRKQLMEGINWPADLLRQVRRALEYMIFALSDRQTAPAHQQVLS